MEVKHRCLSVTASALRPAPGSHLCIYSAYRQARHVQAQGRVCACTYTAKRHPPSHGNSTQFAAAQRGACTRLSHVPTSPVLQAVSLGCEGLQITWGSWSIGQFGTNTANDNHPLVPNSNPKQTILLYQTAIPSNAQQCALVLRAIALDIHMHHLYASFIYIIHRSSAPHRSCQLRRQILQVGCQIRLEQRQRCGAAQSVPGAAPSRLVILPWHVHC
mmetsp:Transcript_6548/g.13556  ORF Transcript_6548/g.13556 Transcript_6548/m.13556 type:complete len:217 (-) Transcript_6548:827-1477(-)